MPSTSLTPSKVHTMFGCWSLARASASRRNRSRTLRLLVGERGRQHLQGNGHPVITVECFENHSHATGADFVEHDVRADQQALALALINALPPDRRSVRPCAQAHGRCPPGRTDGLRSTSDRRVHRKGSRCMNLASSRNRPSDCDVSVMTPGSERPPRLLRAVPSKRPSPPTFLAEPCTLLSGRACSVAIALTSTGRGSWTLRDHEAERFAAQILRAMTRTRSISKNDPIATFDLCSTRMIGSVHRRMRRLRAGAVPE